MRPHGTGETYCILCENSLRISVGSTSRSAFGAIKKLIAVTGSLWYSIKQLEDLRLSGRGDKYFLQTHGGRK